MEFNYRYSGSSHVKNDASTSSLSFVPDTLREPTFFCGHLNKHIPFREAISALHAVVVSDLRFKPKDKTEYKAWAKKQEGIWMAEMLADAKGIGEQVERLRSELKNIRQQKSKVMAPFYKAQKTYFNHIYKKAYDFWFVLDPVITVHPDEIFFECFSQDESCYGRLDCNYNVFTGIDTVSYGTTNIDYSASLYNEFQKIRDYKDTKFEIDPSGFTVKTTQEEVYKEVKIDLPDSWVRGFLQVSSAMTLPAKQFELHPMDLHNFCFILQRFKEKESPRSMRYLLEPDKPIRVIFEPWNLEVKCPRSIYKADTPAEIRVWGRRRLLILMRLLPLAKRFQVSLLGSGMPSFYVADLGDMRFTLGLSGWTDNDWAGAANFDLMLPRKDVDAITLQKIYVAFKKAYACHVDTLVRQLQLEKSSVQSALISFVQAGRAIYDLEKKIFRVRELTQGELPVDTLRFSSERERMASSFLDQKTVTLFPLEENKQSLILSGTVKDKRKKHTLKIVMDSDGGILEANCECNYFRQNKLYKGPCEHIMALRIAFMQKQRV